MPDAGEVAPWIPLAAAIVGALLAGAFVLLGARAGARNEAAKWRRERRYEVYSAFLAEVDRRLEVLVDLEARTLNQQPVLRSEVDAITPHATSRLSASLVVVGPSNVVLWSLEIDRAFEFAEGAVGDLVHAYLDDRAEPAGARENRERLIEDVSHYRLQFILASQRPLGIPRYR